LEKRQPRPEIPISRLAPDKSGCGEKYHTNIWFNLGLYGYTGGRAGSGQEQRREWESVSPWAPSLGGPSYRCPPRSLSLSGSTHPVCWLCSCLSTRHSDQRPPFNPITPILPPIPPSSPRPTIAPKETIGKKSQNLVGNRASTLSHRPSPDTKAIFGQVWPRRLSLCQRSRQLTGSRQHSLQHCHGAWKADSQTALSRF
jgi:hypothetical protein